MLYEYEEVFEKYRRFLNIEDKVGLGENLKKKLIYFVMGYY